MPIFQFFLGSFIIIYVHSFNNIYGAWLCTAVHAPVETGGKVLNVAQTLPPWTLLSSLNWWQRIKCNVKQWYALWKETASFGEQTNLEGVVLQRKGGDPPEWSSRRLIINLFFHFALFFSTVFWLGSLGIIMVQWKEYKQLLLCYLREVMISEPQFLHLRSGLLRGLNEIMYIKYPEQ